jgi:hypothetical protein
MNDDAVGNARTRFLGRVLAHYGLRLDDWGSVYVVRDDRGGWAVAGDTAALWIEAGRLAGQPLDPLDPGLVNALG